MSGTRISTWIRSLPWQSWRVLFTIDSRALALARMGCGVTILLDLALRGREISVFYVSSGLSPRTGFLYSDWGWSLHTLFDSVSWVAVVFILHALVALALLVGYRTRIVTIAALLFAISLEHANQLIFNGGDQVLRLLLFAGVFLPWGAYASYDALKAGRFLRVEGVCSPWTIVVLLQVMFIYVFAFLHKSGAEWENGSAIFYAVTSRYGTHIGEFLGTLPELSPVLVLLVLGFQVCAPLCIFSPLYPVQLRTFALCALALMHVAFAFTLSIGWFPLIMLIALSLFIPRETLDFVFARLARLWKRFDSWARSPKEGYAARMPRGWQLVALKAGAVVYLALVLAWNVDNIMSTRAAAGPLPSFDHRPSFLLLMRSIGLDQHWSLFAPSPPITQMWLVARVVYESGNETDALRDFALLSWERPDLLKDAYVNRRWSSFLAGLTYFRNKEHLARMGDYFCRIAARDGGQPVVVEIYDVRGPTHFVEPEAGPFKRTLLKEVPCGTGE